MKTKSVLKKQDIEMIAEALEWMLETDLSLKGRDRESFKRFAKRFWRTYEPEHTTMPDELLNVAD